MPVTIHTFNLITFLQGKSSDFIGKERVLKKSSSLPQVTESGGRRDQKETRCGAWSNAIVYSLLNSRLFEVEGL